MFNRVNIERSPPSNPTDTLRQECHGLIEQIAQQLYSAKRLTAAKSALELAANYKQGRSHRDPHTPKE